MSHLHRHRSVLVGLRAWSTALPVQAPTVRPALRPRLFALPGFTVPEEAQHLFSAGTLFLNIVSARDLYYHCAALCCRSGESTYEISCNNYVHYPN